MQDLLKTKRETFQKQLDEAVKFHGQVVAKLNETNQRIEQLRGAIQAVDMLVQESAPKAAPELKSVEKNSDAAPEVPAAEGK